MTTNVPAPIFGPSGFTVASDASILSGVFADMQAAFGGGLNPSLSSPQGQLASSLAAIIGEVNTAFLFFVAQTDPAFASGRFQDAIARLYFLARRGSLPTSVEATLGGAVGTIVPAGSLASATDGTMYQSADAAMIGSGGTVNVQFEALVPGPFPLAANALTRIVSAIPGWDTITNAGEGILGRDTETRAELEARRGASVSKNAVAIVQAVRGEVLEVPDVVDAYVTENPTASSATIGGVSIAARSLYVAVAGGADADVARAIWNKKPPGCGMVGGTTVTVQDTGSGYQPPYPSYSIKFQRPTALPIYFNVQIASGPDVPSNAAQQIKDAIVAAFAGKDGGARAGIGATIYAGRFIPPVASLGAWAGRLVSLNIGTTGPGALDSIAVNIDKIPTLDPAHITVAVV